MSDVSSAVPAARISRDVSLSLPTKMLLAEMAAGSLEGRTVQESVKKFKGKCVPSRLGEQWQKSYGRQVERLVEEVDRTLAKSGQPIVGRYKDGLGLSPAIIEKSRELSAATPAPSEAEYDAVLASLDLDQLVPALLAEDPLYVEAQQVLAQANTPPRGPVSLKIEHMGLPVAASNLAAALTEALGQPVDIEDVLAQAPARDEHPLLAKGGPLDLALQEYLRVPTHPFFRVIDWPGDDQVPAGRYLALGAAEGTFRKGPHQGKKGAVTFKVGRPGCDPTRLDWQHAYTMHYTLAAQVDGRPAKVTGLGADGWTRTIWMLRAHAGAVYKLWVNVVGGGGRADDPNGYRTIVTRVNEGERVTGWEVVPEAR